MKQAQGNIDLVTATLSDFEAGKLEAGLEHFEDEARWGVAKLLPNGGLSEGKDAIRKMLGQVRERFNGGYRFLHLNVYGASDHVFAETTRTGGDDSYSKGSEHVLLSFHVVMGRVREVREFVYAIH